MISLGTLEKAAALLFAGAAVVSTGLFIARKLRVDAPTKESLIRTAITVLHCPSALVAATWYTVTHRSVVLSAVPALFRSYSDTLTQVMPLRPRNLTEAFEFGKLYQMFASGSKPVEEIIRAFSQLTGRVVTAANIEAVANEIKLMDSHRGISDRVLATFTIVNVMWGLSILGITAFAAPFLHLIAAPLVKIVVRFVRGIVIPLLLMIHEKLQPLYESLAYAGIWYTIVESLRYGSSSESMTGTMLAFTSLVFTAAATVSTAFMRNTWVHLSAPVLFLVSAPLAVAHESRFLGYLSISALLASLGFFVISNENCVILGWKDIGPLRRTALSCLGLNLAVISSRVWGLAPELMKPFQSAISVYGTAVYFLAMWIDCISSRNGTILLASNIAVYLAVGELLGLQGMANTAKVYGALLLMTVYWKIVPKKDGPMIASVFGSCCLAFYASLFLNRNPQYIAALFYVA